jgi:hypothetical protein
MKGGGSSMGEVLTLKGLGELTEDLINGLVSELRDIRAEDPEGFEKFDFEMFKSALMSVFQVYLLDEDGFVRFFDGHRVINIRKPEQFLEIIDKYYKPLRRLYHYVMSRV